MSLDAERSGRDRAATTVALLALLSFLAYALRTNIGVAKQLMMPDLGLTDADMAWVFGSFQLTYMLFQSPAGSLGDRFGSRGVLTIAVLGWAVTTGLTGFLPGTVGMGSMAALIALAMARGWLGIFEAATYPVGTLAVAESVPDAYRGRANGIFIGASMLGAASASYGVAWLMTQFGWRASFYVASACAGIGALCWFWMVPKGRGPTRSAVSRPPSLTWREWGRLVADRDVLLLCLSYIAQGYVLFIFIFWLYTYLTDVRGFTILKGGFFGALPWLAAAVGMPLGGMASDRWSRKAGHKIGRRRPAMIGLAGTALFLVIGAWVPNPFVAVGCLAMAMGLLGFAEPCWWAVTNDIGGANRGAVAGILNTAGNIGGFLSTTLLPSLNQRFGWVATLSSAGVLGIIGALLWLGIDATPRDGVRASRSVSV